MATAPGAGFSGSKKVWSDRKANEEGNITAINIKKRDTGCITRIWTRWDSKVFWSVLAQIRRQLDSLAAVRQVWRWWRWEDTTREEAIAGVSGVSDEDYGHTRSLKASTTAERNWGPHGDHTPAHFRSHGDKSLRSSPHAKLRLRFISGDQAEDNWILR